VQKPWSQAMRGFFVAGLVVAILFVLILPPIVSVISEGTVRVPLTVRVAFALLIVVQSVHLPSAMLLVSPAWLRFQSACVAAMLMLNLPLSWWLAGSLGAAGPVAASVVAIAAAQLVPGWLKARQAASRLDARVETAQPVVSTVS
jgi:hypothetical protein